MSAHVSLPNQVRDIGLNIANETLTDPLAAWALLKEIEDAVKEAKDLVRPSAVAEAEKYGKTGVARGGLLLTYKSGSGRWNYDNVKQLVPLLKEVERYQMMAKNANLSGGNVADDNGEVVNPATVKYDQDTVVCTKIKKS